MGARFGPGGVLAEPPSIQVLSAPTESCRTAPSAPFAAPWWDRSRGQWRRETLTRSAHQGAARGDGDHRERRPGRRCIKSPSGLRRPTSSTDEREVRVRLGRPPQAIACRGPLRGGLRRLRGTTSFVRRRACHVRSRTPVMCSTGARCLRG